MGTDINQCRFQRPIKVLSRPAADPIHADDLGPNLRVHLCESGFAGSITVADPRGWSRTAAVGSPIPGGANYDN